MKVDAAHAPLQVAFVGITRSFSDIPAEYLEHFIQYHLEIPYYYALYGRNNVYITTNSMTGWSRKFDTGGSINVIYESELIDDYDAVIHWRSWRDDLFRPSARNFLHTCDHSYPKKWKDEVEHAFRSQRLDNIICYRTWHARHMIENELPWLLKAEENRHRVITDLTLGVDTDIYVPSDDKDPFNLLWSSDPGRGLQHAIPVAVELFARYDRRYRLHVCYPDYVDPRSVRVSHPAIVVHGNVPNGPKLWSMFNVAGFLPYTSTFPEPSSRAHRQAQAAGACVLYPSAMGSPSELIESFGNGVVMERFGLDGEPVHGNFASAWPGMIHRLNVDGSWREIGVAARALAESENWAVQAQRFNRMFQ